MLSDKDKNEIKQACKETEEVYAYQQELRDNKEITDSWMFDSERFMYFQYMESKALRKHSRTLTRWTIAIAALTFALLLATAWSIIDAIFNISQHIG
jgi:hypothetical protein